MRHPETFCAEVAAALTTDTFGFQYGPRPDQNFDADELTYPMIFLDKPITAHVQNTKGTYRLLRIKLGLFFAYKASIDQTEPSKFTAIKTMAWEAAREFVLRLRKLDDDIRDVVDEQLTDVDHVFDINLAGCYAEITVDVIDAGPVCLT